MVNQEPETERQADPQAVRTAAARARYAGFAWAALALTIFSGWFVVTRLGVTRELRIWDITALRFGVGAIVLLPTVLRRQARLPAGAWAEGLLFALLWGSPFVLLVALGLKLTSAAQAATIAPTLMPVFAGVLAWIFLRAPQGRLRWLGYGAILAGLICLVAAGTPGQAATSPAGIAALIAAAAMWAVYTLLFRRSGMTSIQAAALICIWSCGLFLPFYFLLGLSRFHLASPGEIVLQIIYQGLLMSGVALVSFNRAVVLLGPAAATVIIALVPALATALAVPVLGEIPSPVECASIAAIVLGVLLVSRPAPPCALPVHSRNPRRLP